MADDAGCATAEAGFMVGLEMLRGVLEGSSRFVRSWDGLWRREFGGMVERRDSWDADLRGLGVGKKVLDKLRSGNGGRRILSGRRSSSRSSVTVIGCDGGASISIDCFIDALDLSPVLASKAPLRLHDAVGWVRAAICADRLAKERSELVLLCEGK